MSLQDDDKVSRKSQGSNLKEVSKSITSSLGSIFKKQNSIKIVPFNGEIIKISSLDYVENHQPKVIES